MCTTATTATMIVDPTPRDAATKEPPERGVTENSTEGVPSPVRPARTAAVGRARRSPRSFGAVKRCQTAPDIAARMLVPPAHRGVNLSSPPPRRTQSTGAWWQSKILRKAVQVVGLEVKRLTQTAPFLNGGGQDASDDVMSHVATFHRGELETGELLGEGNFSQCYKVDRIVLHDHSGDHNNNTTNNINVAEVSAEQHRQRQLRLELQQACANGDAGGEKFAVKHLKFKLLKKPREFQLAVADLVVEAQYLARLNHPNILKLRGIATGGYRALGQGQYDSFFVILDQLQETLAQRIQSWQTESIVTTTASDQDNDDAVKQFHRQRISQKYNYAQQIASALTYLHQRRILFRDLKPQNIGLKDDHTIQLFDLGLSRELPPAGTGRAPPTTTTTEAEDFPLHEEVFEMSGAGTRRYMAGEIFTTKRYNAKADVYSWSMVFYELLTETKPYAHFSSEQHQTYVCENGDRPSLSADLFPNGRPPKDIQYLLRQAWAHDVTKRLTMEQVESRMEHIRHKNRRRPTLHAKLLVQIEAFKEMEISTDEGAGQADVSPPPPQESLLEQPSHKNNCHAPGAAPLDELAAALGAWPGTTATTTTTTDGEQSLVNIFAAMEAPSDELDRQSKQHRSSCGLDFNTDSMSDVTTVTLNGSLSLHQSIPHFDISNVDPETLLRQQTLDRTIYPTTYPSSC